MFCQSSLSVKKTQREFGKYAAIAKVTCHMCHSKWEQPALKIRQNVHLHAISFF